MRIVAGLILVVTLAACSKQESPLPGPAATPAGNTGGSSPSGAHAPSGHTAPPTPETTTAGRADQAGAQLAAPSANAATPPEGGASSAPAAVTNSAASSADGEALFTSTCATCHMADGGGVPFLQPSIKGSAWISNPDPQLLLSLILRGSAILGEAAGAYDNDMAPQEHLTDPEIAAVATYVRTRFAAPPVGKPVTPAEVATARTRPGLPQ